MEKALLWTVSGGAPKNLLIQQKESALSIEHTVPGSFYAFSYDDEWYFVVAHYVSVENCDVNIKLFHPNGPASSQFFRLSCDDNCGIPLHDITTKKDPPSSGSTDFTALTVINLMWFTWHPFPGESLTKSVCVKANKYILLDSNI